MAPSYFPSLMPWMASSSVVSVNRYTDEALAEDCRTSMP